jgi:preprotein translocase subunit SecE
LVFGAPRFSGPRRETALISVIKRQVKDLSAELNRVDWPSKDKVKGATYAVVIVSVFVGVYLWGADVVFSWLTKHLLPRH